MMGESKHMKNLSDLHNWFLMKYPDTPGFGMTKHLTEDLFQYFALPTDKPICLFGNTYNDTRANPKTTRFTDGHRILTGDLISFSTERAETERSIYTLYSMHPEYAVWLETQCYIFNTGSNGHHGNNLLDLFGGVQFADGYDYKALREGVN